MNETRLTPKQARFVEEYLVDLNAGKAAERAGYSPRTARSAGARLLTNVDIQAAISEAQQRRSEITGITAERVLQELALLCFSDVRDFNVSTTGALSLREGANDAAWRSVASVKHKIRSLGDFQTERTIEIRLWDKNAALEKIAKHIQFYPPEKIEHSGEVAGSGVLVVPGVASAADWSKATQEQQQGLEERKKALSAKYGVD